jgi:hypothetical protein
MADTPPPSGYSRTPLRRKLGFKDGQAVAFVALDPALGGLPSSAAFAQVARVEAARDLKPGAFDMVHAFVTHEADYAQGLPALKASIKPDGAIWMSWPKTAAAKARGIATDLTDAVIRRHALQGGLVDVKVCAVDDTWSGLKLVIPLAARKAAAAPH